MSIEESFDKTSNIGVQRDAPCPWIFLVPPLLLLLGKYPMIEKVKQFTSNSDYVKLRHVLSSVSIITSNIQVMSSSSIPLYTKVSFL